MSVGGSIQGSSRTPHSMARPHRLSSMEYGDFFVVGTSMPCAWAHSISSERVCRSHSRTGAIISMSGSSMRMLASKRTWSLPLPVQPCAMYFAPNLCAASTRCLEISGRDSADTSGYLFSYRALAASALDRKSWANTSRMSTTRHSTAPVFNAFCLIFSRPSCSCPTSPTTAMTSRFFSSWSHLMHTDVSSPPEYASTALSFCWVC